MISTYWTLKASILQRFQNEINKKIPDRCTRIWAQSVKRTNTIAFHELIPAGLFPTPPPTHFHQRENSIMKLYQSVWKYYYYLYFLAAVLRYFSHTFSCIFHTHNHKHIELLVWTQRMNEKLSFIANVWKCRNLGKYPYMKRNITFLVFFYLFIKGKSTHNFRGCLCGCKCI